MITMPTSNMRRRMQLLGLGLLLVFGLGILQFGLHYRHEEAHLHDQETFSIASLTGTAEESKAARTCRFPPGIVHHLQHRMKKPVAVLIPFPEKQVDRVLQRLADWDTDAVFPCRGDGSFDKLELVLYFARDFASQPELRKKLEDVIHSKKWFSKCISKVNLISANLSDQHDAYVRTAQVYNSNGPFYMFFNLFRDAAKVGLGHLGYIFWYEPDLVPIRRYWMDRLQVETYIAPDFWSLGSMNRDVPHPESDGLPFMINGAAIYKLNDLVFNRFLEDIRHAYAPHAFDILLYAYRTSKEHWKERQQRYGHHFVFTEYIFHYGEGKPPMSIADFKSDHKEDHSAIYIIHGPTRP